MNILIPMAGAGSRFANVGYRKPKPLIDVNGKPMIQRVVENLDIEGKYIFLVQQSHNKYGELTNFLLSITNGNARVVEVDGVTEGAACTTLLAEKFIDTDEPLLIANSDQIVEYSKENLELIKRHLLDTAIVDGLVWTFYDSHPKWSFVDLDYKGFVTEVAEKNPISNIATCGIYTYASGKEYVKYTKQMISKNIRVKDEFYIAPVYNEYILDGKKIVPFFVDKMWGIGTPEDLQLYLKLN